MTGVAFFTSTNSWRWRSGKLVPGGDAKWVFIPEAKKFAETWPNTKLVSINCQRTKGLKQYLRFLKIRLFLDGCEPKSLDDVSFYGHGWPTKMQHSMSTANLWALADMLTRVLKPDGQVFFNCCSMARGPKAPKSGRYDGNSHAFREHYRGSFISELAYKLWRQDRGDIVVYGHYTSGHATRNPYVVASQYSMPGKGIHSRGWVVPPASRWDRAGYKKAGNLKDWYANRANWLAWIDFLKTNDLKTAVKQFGSK